LLVASTSTSAWAGDHATNAPAKNAAQTKSIADPVKLREVRADLAQLHAPDFEPLLQKWEQAYGTDGFGTLLWLAKDKKESDSHRYIALMGAAKIGGQASAPELVPLLKDPSWMVRSAALHALGGLGNPATSEAVLTLLHDPALVVR